MIGTRTRFVVGTLCAALSVGCGSEDDDKDGNAPNAIHIGALTDETGPSASPLYRNAVALSSKQMNLALSNAGSKVRFAISFADSQSNGALSQSSAKDLINENKVVGVVTDISGDTVSVNTLNYQDEPLADYKVPVTCYLCSSAFINNPEAKAERAAARQAALRDEDNWLFRTFFNAKYEAAVQTQILLGTDGGDLNGDGVVKVGGYAINDAYGQSS